MPLKEQQQLLRWIRKNKRRLATMNNITLAHKVYLAAHPNSLRVSYATFRVYLRDCGIRKKKAGPEMVRESLTDRVIRLERVVRQQGALLDTLIESRR